MTGLVTLLLFAGFFYFMMRFGCGAHAVHGHGGGGHGGHGGGAAEQGGHGTARQASRAVDPVCGMEVEAGQGYTKPHRGQEYRLCSRACLDKFEANPDQYVQPHGGHR